MKKSVVFILLVMSFFLAQSQNRDTLTVVTYNLLNFPDGRNDCGTNIEPVNRYDTLQKIMEYIQPDVLMVCELHASGEDLVLDSCLNINGISHYAKANIGSNPTSDILHSMLYYNTNKLSLKSQSDLLTGSSRYVGEYLLYGNDPNLATHNDTTFMDFFECHLKAGSAAANVTERGTASTAIRNYANSNTKGVNIIGGDFNFYTDAEVGYQTLCYAAGTFPYNDPINREGAWNNNCAFSDVHTQSTRAIGTTPIECGGLGGVDDRFDFLLVSDTILPTGNRVHYVTGTYTALGNNGSTCNGSINDAGNTSAIPDSILNALYYMSDHLPVVMKLAIEYPNPNCTDPAPTLQDSLITFNNIAGSTMTINWDAANGTERIVVMNTSNSFTNPIDGTDPAANSVYGGAGEQVIFNGPGNSVTVSGLTASTEYWFRVYAYSCAGDSIRFNTATAPGNPNSQISGSCAPILEDNFGSGLSLWNNTASWADINGELKHNVNTSASDYAYSDFTAQDFSTANYEWEVCMRNGTWDPSMSNYFGFFLTSTSSNLLGTPDGYAVGVDFTKSSDEIMLYRVDNGIYTSLITIPQSTFDWDASEEVCLRVTRSDIGEWELFYSINASAEVSAGTITETTYTTGQFAGPIFTHTTGPSNDLYYDNVLVCKKALVPCSDPAPTVQDNLIVFSNTEGNSLNITWTEGNGIGRVVKINTVNSFTTPINGSDPTANTVYAGGEQVIYNDTTGNSVIVTGLDPSTEYWVRVYGYNCTGDSTKYNSDPAVDNPINQTTTCHGVLFQQYFDGTADDNWNIASGGLYASNTSGVSDFSPNAERILSGNFSWQINNTTGQLVLDPVSVIGYDSIVVKARVSAIDVPSGNGLDGGDALGFSVNVDGAGFPVTPDIEIIGNTNADWGYSDGSGVAIGTAGTPVSFAPGAGGEHRTTDGYSNVHLSVPDGSSSVSLQVDANNNSLNEVWCVENLEIYGCFTPPCTDPAPATQASLITFSSVTTSSITLNWTNGDGAGSIVKINSVNSFTDPLNGTDPSANTAYGGGEQVIYRGTGNSVTVTGLFDTTAYWFRVYEFNCSGDSIKFNTSTATGNPLSDTTLEIPVGSCNNIFTDNFGGTLAQWNNTTDWTITSSELAHNLSGVSGSSYTYADLTTQDFTLNNYQWEFCYRIDNSWDPSSANKFEFFLFSSGTDLSTGTGYSVGVNQSGTGDQVMLYEVTGGAHTAIITGTTLWDAGDDICIRVTRSSTGDWELFVDDNGAGENSEGTINNTTYTSGQYIGPTFTYTTTRAGLFWVDTVSVCVEPDICTDPEPTTQATDIITTGKGTNSLSISWTNGNGAGRVVYIDTNNVFIGPSDGADPIASSVYSGGEQAVYNGTGNTVTVTGLSPNTEYCFHVFEYSCSADRINFNNNTATNNPYCDTTSPSVVGGCAELFGQRFDGGDTWGIASGAGLSSTNAGGGDGSPVSERIVSGTNSWQVNNTTGILDLNTISVSGYTSVVIKARVIAIDRNGSNGLDGTDSVRFYVDIDGSGFPASEDLAIRGNNNADWGHTTGTGLATGTAGTPVVFQPAGGGNRTADGYSFVEINVPDGSSTVALRIRADNNSSNEVWTIDDIVIEGCGGLCNDPAPTLPDSLITFSNDNGSQIDVSWTSADGTGAIVVINTVNSFTNPTNGTDPVANPAYSGTGEQIVYNGSGSSVTVSGLAAYTEYWYRVFSYNCNGDSIKFNTTTATDNPLNDTTAFVTGVGVELDFRSIPTVCVQTDSLFSVKICAVDGGGNMDTSYNDLTALRINSEPGGATLTGNLIRTATDGCVIFDSLSLDVTGDYTLLATNGTLTGISDSIQVDRNCVGQSTWEGLIINEFSNGTSGAQEYYEFLVAGECGQSVDIRGYILDDNNGTFSLDWTGTGTGVAQGHFRFKDTPHWALVPVGSIIVIYNADDPNPSLPADDPYDRDNDSLYVVPHNNTILFENCGSIPISTTDTSYLGCIYTSGNDWDDLGIRNGGDAVQVRSPDGSYFHGVSYGNGVAPNDITGGPDSLLVSTSTGGSSVYFFGDTDYRDVVNWTASSITVNPTDETPGDFNSVLNEAYIKTIRDPNAASCPIQEPFVLKLDNTPKPITNPILRPSEEPVASMFIYPNPNFSGTLHLNLQNVQSSYFNVNVMDIFGRTIKQFHLENAKEDLTNSWTVNISDISSGMYILELTGNQEVLRGKIKVIK